MLFNVAYIGVPVSKQPVIPDEYLAVNGNRSRRSVSYNDVPGASFHFQIHRPAHLKRPIERPLWRRSESRGGKQKQPYRNCENWDPIPNPLADSGRALVVHAQIAPF
jgi:hypothetical protein